MQLRLGTLPNFHSQLPIVTHLGSQQAPMAISGLPNWMATRLGASAPAVRSANFLSQQGHGGSQQAPMAISGLPRAWARLGASAPAARSANFLSQQPRAPHLGSQPDPMAISGLLSTWATRLGASAPAAR